MERRSLSRMRVIVDYIAKRPFHWKPEPLVRSRRKSEQTMNDRDTSSRHMRQSIYICCRRDVESRSRQGGVHFRFRERDSQPE